METTQLTVLLASYTHSSMTKPINLATTCVPHHQQNFHHPPFVTNHLLEMVSNSHRPRQVHVTDGKCGNQHLLCDERKFVTIANVLLNPWARVVKDKVAVGCSRESKVVVVPTIFTLMECQSLEKVVG
jgi:hypothetical protein